MVLPVFPNPISFADVNVELGRSSTWPVSLNDSDVRLMAERTLVGQSISMSHLHGKSSAEVFDVKVVRTAISGKGPIANYYGVFIKSTGSDQIVPENIDGRFIGSAYYGDNAPPGFYFNISIIPDPPEYLTRDFIEYISLEGSTHGLLMSGDAAFTSGTTGIPGNPEIINRWVWSNIPVTETDWDSIPDNTIREMRIKLND